jgi:hypothetical protein
MNVSLSSFLPTALGCHFEISATSERRRFGAALGQGNVLDGASKYIVCGVTPSEFASGHPLVDHCSGSRLLAQLG